MCVCAQSLNRVWLFVTLWTLAHQAPLSMRFSRQEYWSGLPFPSPGDLLGSGIEPKSYVSCVEDRFFTAESLGKPPGTAKSQSVVSDSVQPHRPQPKRLPHPWDSPGKNTGGGCHFLLQSWKWKVKVRSLSHVWLLATPWTTAYQAPLSMGFSMREYWSGLPLPSPPPGTTEV